MEAKITQKYQPLLKNAVFEAPKDFTQIIKEYNIDEQIFQSQERQQFRTIANSLSFFYSRAKAIELKKEQEKNNFQYDCVITCRFDLGQIDKYNGYHPYKVSQVNFDENLDMDHIYSAMWNQLNCGYADQWFYGNSANIDLLAEMYEKSLQYFMPKSDFIKTLCNGWPDSNIKDEFSNEFFKSPEFKSKNLMKYQIYDAINNHLMHKWFFIDVELYQKSRFV